MSRHHLTTYLLSVIYIIRLSTLDPSLSKGQVAALWKLIDPSDLKYVELQDLHRYLSERFGKDKSTTRAGSSVVDRAVAKILERAGGQGGIKGLSRILSIMDDNGDKRLTKEELK